MMIVDRIMGDIAVCESDGVLLELPLAEICGDVCEGVIINPNADGKPYAVNAVETDKRYTALSDRFDRLKNRRKNQDE